LPLRAGRVGATLRIRRGASTGWITASGFDDDT